MAGREQAIGDRQEEAAVGRGHVKPQLCKKMIRKLKIKNVLETN